MNMQGNCADGANQGFVIALPYWSVVRLRLLRSGAPGGPYSYTLRAGTKVQAFSYGRGGDKTAAGFSAADGPALDRDTNIAKAYETINGEALTITGMSVIALQSAISGEDANLRLADEKLVKAIFEQCLVRMKLNVRGEFDFGLPIFLPGSAGLEGSGRAASSYRALAGDMSTYALGPNNGTPLRANTYALPDNIVWQDQGSDSLFQVNFVFEKDIIIWSGDDVDNKLVDVAADNAFDSVATGTDGYNFPSELIQDMCVQLHGVIEGQRSRTI